MKDVLQEGKFEGFRVNGITIEQVIGSVPGNKKKRHPETHYALVTLDGLPQKFLAIAEEGSDEIQLLEAKDAEEAGELMFDHIGEKLGKSPKTKAKNL